MQTDTILPNRIRELRKRKNLTLKQLAPVVDTTFGHLQRMEVGRRELSVGWMRAIGSALGTVPSDLLSVGDGGLSQNERQLVEIYRGGTPEIRSMLDALVKASATEACSE